MEKPGQPSWQVVRGPGRVQGPHGPRAGTSSRSGWSGISCSWSRADKAQQCIPHLSVCLTQDAQSCSCCPQRASPRSLCPPQRPRLRHGVRADEVLGGASSVEDLPPQPTQMAAS